MTQCSAHESVHQHILSFGPLIRGNITVAALIGVLLNMQALVLSFLLMGVASGSLAAPDTNATVNVTTSIQLAAALTNASVGCVQLAGPYVALVTGTLPPGGVILNRPLIVTSAGEAAHTVLDFGSHHTPQITVTAGGSLTVSNLVLANSSAAGALARTAAGGTISIEQCFIYERTTLDAIQKASPAWAAARDNLAPAASADGGYVADQRAWFIGAMQLGSDAVLSRSYLVTDPQACWPGPQAGVIAVDGMTLCVAILSPSVKKVLVLQDITLTPALYNPGGLATVDLDRPLTITGACPGTTLDFTGMQASIKLMPNALLSLQNLRITGSAPQMPQAATFSQNAAAPAAGASPSFAPSSWPPDDSIFLGALITQPGARVAFSNVTMLLPDAAATAETTQLGRGASHPVLAEAPASGAAATIVAWNLTAGTWDAAATHRDHWRHRRALLLAPPAGAAPASGASWWAFDGVSLEQQLSEWGCFGPRSSLPETAMVDDDAGLYQALADPTKLMVGVTGDITLDPSRWRSSSDALVITRHVQLKGCPSDPGAGPLTLDWQNLAGVVNVTGMGALDFSGALRMTQPGWRSDSASLLPALFVSAPKARVDLQVCGAMQACVARPQQGCSHCCTLHCSCIVCSFGCAATWVTPGGMSVSTIWEVAAQLCSCMYGQVLSLPNWLGAQELPPARVMPGRWLQFYRLLHMFLSLRDATKHIFSSAAPVLYTYFWSPSHRRPCNLRA